MHMGSGARCTPCAHHLHPPPCRFSHPLDPPSVKHARAVEEWFISKWIQDARCKAASSLGRRGAPVGKAAAVA